MTISFTDLTDRTRQAALEVLEDWPDRDDTTDVVERVLTVAYSMTLPSLDKVDGEWVMQMMWQVPDLLETTTYTDTQDVNATVRHAVQVRVCDLIRDDIADRAGELGLDPSRMRI